MGFTSKEEFQRVMHRYLDPLKPLYSRDGARLMIDGAGATYPEEVIELEAFSRPLWALVPFWAGGGNDEAFQDIYVRGLQAGCDPQHPEYWGGFSDYDQRFVEMAALACGLLFTPEILWEPLSEDGKENLCRWLEGINRYIIPDCNWQFFRILVNVALKKLGRAYSEAELEKSLNDVDSYYLGDGWYRDGASSQKDYYVSFALHYYGLIYATVMGEEDPERSKRFRERALRFAEDFIYWFGEDGSALPFGRSLAYRFAQAGFWSACLFAGIEPFPVGVMKGLLCRHMEYWEKQQIVDRDGILTVGYAYPNLLMAERYNAPGSPYWSMKTFLCLALPDDHPFWTAEAEPLPKLDQIRALPKADMLMHRIGGDIYAYTPGSCELYGHGQLVQKYGKFAYSTRFGFSVSRSHFVLHENAPDSMLAFVPEGEDMVYVRKNGTAFEIRPDSVYSEWSPLPGIQVKTEIIPTAEGHIRRHSIESLGRYTAYDCGFSVPLFKEGYAVELGEDTASVKNRECGCEVRGKGPGLRPMVIDADPNTNILYKNTRIPAIAYIIGEGVTQIETDVKVWVNR